MSTALGIVLAVLSAFGNATVNVTQRRATRRVQPGASFSPRVVRELLRQPLWRFGLLLGALTFVLEAVAMGLAALAIVQPILVIELPLTLIGASHFIGGRLKRREWVAIAVMTAGLAVMLASLDAHGDRYDVRPLTWTLWAGACGLVIIGLAVAAQLSRGATRTALLGCATGVCFGLSAALMKGMAGSFAGGIGATVHAWETYAAVATGMAGTWLYQSALHAGPLVLAQPGITLLDPLVAIVFGIFLFGEHTNGGLNLLYATLGGCAIGAGVVVLARSTAMRLHSTEAGVREAIEVG